MKAEPSPRVSRAKAEEVSELDRARFLSALYKAHIGQGERSTRAIAQRAGFNETRAIAIRRRLSDLNLIASTGYGDYAAWHLTDAGWQAIGVRKPIWMED